MYYKFIYLWILLIFLQKHCFTIIFNLPIQIFIIYWYLSLIKPILLILLRF